jgi:uncharacterized membrane protein
MKQAAIEEGKVYAFLSYWGILCLLALLAKRDNDFALYHAKQGLVLWLISFVITGLAFIPVLGWFVIGPVGGLVILILAIIGMVKSLSGEYWRMPLFGGLAEKIEI